VFVMTILNDNRSAMFNRNTKTKWQTPKWFFSLFDEKYSFEWDMAASKRNRLCKKYVNKTTDSTSFEWPGNSSLWCNPPYDSRQLHKWFSRGWEAARNGSTVVFLVHGRTDTIWFHEWAVRGTVYFVRARMRFLYRDQETDAAPFPSLVVIYDHKSVQKYESRGNGIDKFCAGTIDGRKGYIKTLIRRYPRKIMRYPRPKNWRMI